mgnify:CR=1 FL=1
MLRERFLFWKEEPDFISRQCFMALILLKIQKIKKFVRLFFYFLFQGQDDILGTFPKSAETPHTDDAARIEGPGIPRCISVRSEKRNTAAGIGPGDYRRRRRTPVYIPYMEVTYPFFDIF